MLLGGIGLFLYGINFMSSSLKEAAGEKLRTVLARMTSNGFTAIIAGVVVTALIQSSGATSVMAIGFVNAGLMNIADALYIMLGANIGTTVTAQIIAFNIDWLAPFILFVGMILYTFIKNKIAKKVGGVVLGFGMLFVGIYIVKLAAEQLNLGAVMESFLKRVDNPLLSLLFGLLVTAVIQSSSASIGILQTLIATSASSILGLHDVFYMILGMNIGAIAPVVLASFSGNRRSRQAAIAGMLLKVFGTIFFILLVLIFPIIETWIISLSPDVSRQIANLHLSFNLVSSVVLFPFVKWIAKLTERILPVKQEDERTAAKLLYLNPELLMTPAIAVMQAKQEVLRMAGLAIDNLKLALKAFFDDDKLADGVFGVENTINFLNHTITSYLISLHGKTLSQKDQEKIGMMFHVVADIERIGDHAENIAEYAQIKEEHHVRFTEAGWVELREISEATIRACQMAIEIYDAEAFDRLEEMTALEEKIDALKEIDIENHIARLKKEECNPRGGVMFTDLVTDLERCGDHAINIACAIHSEETLEVKKNYVIERISQ